MRLLFLCHAHPDLQAGGTEIFSHGLFRALRRRPGFRGAYLAGTSAGQRPPSPGTPFQAIEGAADELLLWTGGFDPFFLSQTDLHGVMPSLAAFLAEQRPDIVHVHHLMTLGVEVVALIRRVVPRARIVMTLHDYYALCANDGQMVTTSGALCRAASSDACQRCFPDRSATDTRLRQLAVQGALRGMDQLVSPSSFLRDRLVAHGVPGERITVLPNGIARDAPAPHRPLAAAGLGRRDRFGFFGHINRFKGATLALQASAGLSRAGVAHAMALHGGTAHQAPDVLAGFSEALRCAPDARHGGAYQRADLPRLMAAVDWVVVPSLWWENAPLVIQEAFLHRRPVICADIGGMAEMVRDGVDGLHFPVGDPAALTDAMHRAADEPGLWQRLVDAIEAPSSIEDAADAHEALYRDVLARRRPSGVMQRQLALQPGAVRPSRSAA